MPTTPSRHSEGGRHVRALLIGGAAGAILLPVLMMLLIIYRPRRQPPAPQSVATTQAAPAPVPAAQPEPATAEPQAEPRSAPLRRPSPPRKEAEAAERERERQIDINFKLLNPIQQHTVRQINAKLEGKGVIYEGEHNFICDHWRDLYDCRWTRNAIWRRTSGQAWFKEFCRNVKMPRAKQPQLAVVFFLIPPRESAPRVALSASRQLRAGGVDALGRSEREFVRRYREVFATILP
jgi:hypothetical protein